MAEEITLRFDYTIPDLLNDKIKVSESYQNYNSKGNPTSFGVDLNFPDMHLSKTLKSSEFYLLREKGKGHILNFKYLVSDIINSTL